MRRVRQYVTVLRAGWSGPPKRGLWRGAAATNNRNMKINSTHLITWESEPADERPSEFMPTGFSQFSGLHATSGRMHSSRRRRPRFGLKSLVAFAIMALVLGAFAIERLAPMLHV